MDDNECTTPCDIRRPVGSTVLLTAPASLSIEEGVRGDFTGWPGSGSTADNWSITLRNDPITLSAGYQIMNRLTAVADPPAGVAWRLQPASADGYYAEQTAVTVARQPLPRLFASGFGTAT